MIGTSIGSGSGKIAAAVVASIVASLILAVTTFVYVPLCVDGGWYSYPAYASSQGGDPSENLPGVARTQPLPNRAVARFGWENRSNSTVLLTDAWFRVVPPSWISVRIFGALQLVLLAVLIAIVVMQLTGSPLLSLFTGCLIASDSRVITEALSDARPDLFIAITGAGLLVLLTTALRSVRPGAVIAAAAVAIVLPTLHVTAAFTIAFFFVFLGMCVVLGNRLANANYRLSVAVLIGALLLASFLLKQHLLDVLIPTQVPLGVEDRFRHHLADELQSIRLGGPMAKLAMELTRWSQYFFRANTVHFLFTLVGLFFAVKVIRKSPYDLPTTLAVSLVVGALSAAIALLVTDSHTMIQHALVVAVLIYAGCAIMLAMAQRASLLDATRLRQVVFYTLAAGALLNCGTAFHVYRQYHDAQISNAAQAAFLLDTLPRSGDLKIIAPTEIWPLLTARRQPLLIIDSNRNVFHENNRPFDLDADPDFAGASYLILNKQYYEDFGWKDVAAAWSRNGLITFSRQLGDCDRGVECLKVYAFTAQAGS
jgi:hypothetical protein